MPILKYKCQECGKEFSKIFFSEDNAPTRCMVCGTDNIVEAGSTFESDDALTQRVLCASCDSCSDEGCGNVSTSS